MSTESKTSIMWIVLYWFVTIGGMMMLISFFGFNVWGWQKDLDNRLASQEAAESPTSKYFLYRWNNTIKDVFERWEPVVINTKRDVFYSHPIGGTDYLHCDLYDGDGFRMISREDRHNDEPVAGIDRSYQWTYVWSLPQSPIGTFVDAKCYIRSAITMKVSGVYKRQSISSDMFFIGDARNSYSVLSELPKYALTSIK